MDSLTNPGFTHCDGEQGVMELGPDYLGGYVYTSACSVPPEIWEEVGCIRQTHECPCGCPEPGFGHPCIGHDELTGRPLEGPATEGTWFQVNRYRETVWIEPAPEPEEIDYPGDLVDPDDLAWDMRGEWSVSCSSCGWCELGLSVEVAVGLGKVHEVRAGHSVSVFDGSHFR